MPSVDSASIGVSVEGGCVTPTGSVSTYPEMLLAAKAALQVRGITAVAQELTVRGPWAAVTDTEIGPQAAEAVDRAVNVPETVKVSVRDHTVTLSGDVAWQYQREAACRAVNYIQGVTAVINDMTVRPGAVAAGIARNITAALVRNAQFEGEHLKVVTDSRGVVTLSGSVRSSTEKRQAEAVCWRTPGVVTVLTLSSPAELPCRSTMLGLSTSINRTTGYVAQTSCCPSRVVLTQAWILPCSNQPRSSRNNTRCNYWHRRSAG